MGIGIGADGLSYHGLDGAMSRYGFAHKDLEDAASLMIIELNNAQELVGIVQ